MRIPIALDRSKSSRYILPNFTVAEFLCKCGECEGYMDVEALACIHAARRILNRPVHLTSAYRCPEYNASIGGAPASFHKRGMALDIPWIDDVSNKILYDTLIVVGFTGFGFYNSFIHADVGPKRTWGDSGILHS